MGGIRAAVLWAAVWVTGVPLMVRRAGRILFERRYARAYAAARRRNAEIYAAIAADYHRSPR